MHLEFVRKYLNDRGIDFSQMHREDARVQIRWTSGRAALCNATTGQPESKEPTLAFDYQDVYDAQGNKRISSRFAHLPQPQALALLQGLIETQNTGPYAKEITFCNTSLSLIEGVRYQLLRFLTLPVVGIPKRNS